ncbi:DJ-1/PfpI family protein [Gilvimarinus sp. DA14]|uniref:DJ-1/PfpI family protein n=1 Tax=Gilvimarinus sp. DA14 TaxID=2956798 RepID=UPI0020B6C9AB|nr:DJ-1/PfpI family protein [Gilvimarinus sp. DA14]UTF60673.1 DJ-1/PfpI family protein [Gilvimarinus sp. DA14]
MFFAVKQSMALVFLLTWCICAAAEPPHGDRQHNSHDSAANNIETVGILIYPGVQIIDFTGPWEVFGHAGYKVATVSKEGKTLSTSMNMTVVPDYSFETAPQFDALLIPGGHHHNAYDESTYNWIKKHAESGKTILSVCTGSFILAEAGLLKEQKATTFFKLLDPFAENYPETQVIRDQRFVDSGKIITSAGLSSGIDAALHLVAKDQGQRAAQTLAMHIEYDWEPEQGFVRGKMADRYMPHFSLPIPEAFTFHREYAYGDESHWYESYIVTLATSDNIKQKTVDLVEEQMAALNDWKPHPKSDSIWIKHSEGKEWRVSMQYTPITKDQSLRYDLSLEEVTDQ